MNFGVTIVGKLWDAEMSYPARGGILWNPLGDGCGSPHQQDTPKMIITGSRVSLKHVDTYDVRCMAL